MEIGIKKYNEECRSIVMRCADDWESTVERMGRWIDFKNDYKTLDMNYMESEWWVFGELHKQGLVYRGFKVMPYSTALSTPLSNFEAKSNYQTRRDPAIVVTFPIIGDEDNTCFLAWTTTPWTLPSNLALCVNPKLTYVKFQDEKGDFYICGKKVLAKSKKENTIMKGRKGFKSKVVAEYKGTDLVGKKYTPLFEYFVERTHCFRVISDSYVTEDEGTGIVHQAPGFGEDDLRACEDHGVHRKGEEDVVCPVDHNGCYTEEVKDYEGQYVLDANPKIIKDLRTQGRLWNDVNFDHEYPHCWRSDTPLLYRAISSWFVKVTALKDRLVANNQKTYWVPSFVGEGRFHNWLEGARDWAVSRNRYWGTPLPIWMSEDEKEWEVISSVAELEQRSGVKITDIHRESIDSITIKSKTTGKTLHRVDEIFDCWFESGSMPYGQCHYPFAWKGKEEEFKKRFPADFIAEGLDQTRGWFYTLLVLSTALFDEPAWKNLIVNGMVLAEDGTKMSKRKKNYPAPEKIFDNYGADALRIYLCSSPVVKAESLKFKEDGVSFICSSVLSPWYNAYNFFVENASRFERTTGEQFVFDPEAHKKMSNIMDLWILSELQSLVKFFRSEMEAYRLYTVLPKLLNFIDLLTNTYVRMNRTRIRGQMSLDDTYCSTQALFTVLLTLCQLMAPMTPFIVDTMYINLKRALGDNAELSVHFMDIPDPNESAIDSDIERRVRNLHHSIKLGRYLRSKHTLKTKMPLAEMMVVHQSKQFLDDVEGLKEYLLSELNVKQITFSHEMADYIKLSAEPEYKSLGSKFGRKTGTLSKAIKKLNHEQLVQLVENKKLALCDEEVTTDDVKVVWNFQGDTKKWVFKEDDGAIVLLDQRITRKLKDEGTSREICNRIQQLRKLGRLTPADRVNVFYRVLSSEDVDDGEQKEEDTLSSVFVDFSDLIETHTRIKCLPWTMKSDYIGNVCSEVTDIEGTRVELALCNLQLFFNKSSPNLAKMSNEELFNVERYLQCQDRSVMEKKYPEGSTFEFIVDDKQYAFEIGTDFSYHPGMAQLK